MPLSQKSYKGRTQNKKILHLIAKIFMIASGMRDGLKEMVWNMDVSYECIFTMYTYKF